MGAFFFYLHLFTFFFLIGDDIHYLFLLCVCGVFFVAPPQSQSHRSSLNSSDAPAPHLHAFALPLS